MSKSVAELKNAIIDGMNIDEIISTFGKWYQPMDEDDSLLFETGTFDFTGEELFYFSLVKQFPNDEEYIQIHIDILYKPDSENKKFSNTFWDETGDEIINYIKKSKEYKYAKIIDTQKLKFMLMKHNFSNQESNLFGT